MPKRQDQEWKFQRRERKQQSERNKMPKHGKDIAETYKNANKNREKDMEKSLLLGKINKVLLKQNALEDASGMSLPSTNPNQMANMSGGTPQQAQQVKQQQQTQNRSQAQQQPQPPQTAGQTGFDASGAVFMAPEIKEKINKFNALDDMTKIKMINSMSPNDPDNYQIIKFAVTRGSPEVQGQAAYKLNIDDLEELVTPTTDNPKSVSALALKTRRPENWGLLLEHSDPKVRGNLVRNRNIQDDFLKDMYDDVDFGVRYNIVDRTDNQDLLHLFIADKNPKIRERLISKLDKDGLKILAKDSHNEIASSAKQRLSENLTDKIHNSDDEWATAGDKNTELPNFGYGTMAGVGDTVRNSMVLKINQFVKKAEIIQKEGGIGGGEGTAMTAADSSTPTFGYSNSIKKKIKDNLQFKSEDGVEGILNIVKSVGEEFFGGK